MKNTIKSLRTPAILAAALAASVLTGFAAPAISVNGVVSPVQSNADPLGLAIAGPVMAAGSDASSQAFDATVLPGALAFIKGIIYKVTLCKNIAKNKRFEVAKA